jgi:hypothetical protein
MHNYTYPRVTEIVRVATQHEPRKVTRPAPRRSLNEAAHKLDLHR